LTLSVLKQKTNKNVDSQGTVREVNSMLSAFLQHTGSHYKLTAYSIVVVTDAVSYVWNIHELW